MASKKQQAPQIDIGIDSADREKIVKGLSVLLADSYTLYLMTHNFHWNVKGPQLNSLHLIANVREREFIFLGERQTTRRPDGAFYHRGMRADELRDLIADGMRAAGAVNVVASNLRPVDFGGREGLRFEMAMDNQAGLKYRAMAAAFEHENGLALALFYAPAEYYYPRDEAKVSAMMDTLRWK